MAKKKVVYHCDECGFETIQWLGKCPQCGLWNTLKEITVAWKKSGQARTSTHRRSEKQSACALSEIEVPDTQRMLLGSDELDRVLGGGIFPHTTVLIAGEPGIGKSTLLLQVCAAVAEKGEKNVLFISAEESLQQVRERSLRLGIGGENVYVIAETNLELLLEYIQEIKPILVVVDSIQAVHEASIPSPSGTITQVREVAAEMSQLAKTEGFVLFLTGHVTKDGVLAGPRTLEHMVDVVVYFEGDRYQSLRIVRTVKNRYGATGEVGIFEMTKEGLRGVKNPSNIFLPTGEDITPGRTTVAVMEGRRPFLVEIQALTNKTAFNNPLRRSLGVELNKVSLLLAVIERSLKLNLYNYDVFVKAVGGLRLSEAACDLAICLAIISSFRNENIPPQIAVIGEIGLGGEVRKVHMLETRIKEASRLGFKHVLVPKGSHGVEGVHDITVREVGTLQEAHDFLFTHKEKKKNEKKEECPTR